MDISSGKWISDLELDDCEHPFSHQWQELSSVGDTDDSFIFNTCFSSNNKMTNQSSTFRSAAAAPPPKVSQICFDKASSSSSTIISFGNSESPTASANINRHGNSEFRVKREVEAMSLENMNPYGLLSCGDEVKRCAVIRTPAQAKDHVLAERKRREKMTGKFVALSALVPGLKKLDKGTVLGGAINYIKDLQERIRTLEEEANKNSSGEEIIVGVKKPRVCGGYEDAYSSDENLDSSLSVQSSSLPEIEVRASEGNVLLRVYCRQQTGIIQEILGEIERHHLAISSSSIIPFGENGLHITIISQISDDSKKTAKDLVDNLHMSIQSLI